MFKLKQKRIIRIKAMAKRGIVFKVNNRIVEKLSKKPFFLYPLSTPHNIPISIEKKAAGKVICKDTPIFENIRELIVAYFLYE